MDAHSLPPLPADAKQRVQVLVRHFFEQLVAQGMQPNDAALEAVARARQFAAAPRQQQPQQPRPQAVQANPNPNPVLAPVLVSSPVPNLAPAAAQAHELSQEVLVDIVQRHKDTQHALQAISDLVGSPQVLGRSFLLDGGQGVVDFAKVTQAMEGLSRVPNAPSLVDVGRAMCRSLPAPPLHHEGDVVWGGDQAKQAVTPTHLQVVLLCPMLFEPELHGSLVLGLLAAIEGLASEQRSQLRKAFEAFSAEALSHAVAVVGHWLTIRLCEHPQADRHSVLAARALELMYQANQQSQAVSVTLFNNDVINTEGSIKLVDQFALWLRAQDGQAVGRSFVEFPFLLDAHSKSQLLRWESQIQMRQEFEQALFQRLFAPQMPSSLFLEMNVRRDNLIRDTIVRIQSSAPSDLKKPLRVNFIGEEGLDAGGVQKEFFQVIVRALFDVNFGMFVLDDDTRCFWFNRNSFDDSEFELVGVVLGLAIYNGVILDVHFPRVVYKKLAGERLSLADLKSLSPSLHHGLVRLLDYEGDSTDLGFAFEVTYESFGEIKSHELKPGGKDLEVDNNNKEEFVELYVKYMLEESVAAQFRAFERGFKRVCGGDVLAMFAAEELELVICGNPELDFTELEGACQYEGYTRESEVVRHLWSILHSWPVELKKRFLSFCTGSDRAPVRGLASMPFVVMRNGPDCDRLPTAHTCFNHFLLPEYSSKAKLERLLHAAVENAEGFGLK